jgi:hypothetical protein
MGYLENGWNKYENKISCDPRIVRREVLSFFCTNEYPDYKHSPSFFTDLQIAVITKRKVLLNVLREVQDIIKVEGTIKEDVSHVRPDVQKNKKHSQLFKTFEELFVVENYAELVLKALQEAGIINSENKYLLGRNDKGAFAACFHVLHIRNHLKPKAYKGEVIAPLLNKKIRDLNVYSDGKCICFAKKTRAYLNYIEHFEEYFPSIRGKK